MEILVVLVIIAILAAVAIPIFTEYIDRAHKTQDLVSLRTLNMGTKLYQVGEGIKTPDVFEGINDNINRQQALQNKGCIEEIMVPNSKDVQFLWYKDAQLWGLSDESPPLTPLGNTVVEISMGMKALLEAYNAKPGVPLHPTSGDERYTALELDPEFWNKSHDHITYAPIRNRIQVAPEEGYQFYVTYKGTEQKQKVPSGQGLKYSLLDGEWYFNEINPGNEIDITTITPAVRKP